PKGQTACECERTQAGDLRQSLFMLTSSTIQNKLLASTSRAAALAKEKERSLEERVEEIYLRAYSRPPRPEELTIAVSYLKRHKATSRAFADLLWSIAKTKEFLYNH
ncbi:MAG TPA: DUF1553 domain-containing protein, partial [Planctomycetaceae bacterium]|nr:DUF1553 domain-containing protein [Planctomycetaceae bacterium]